MAGPTYRGERLLHAVRRGSTWLGLALVAASLAGAWAIAWESGSATAISRHWFYVPIILAAVRFGVVGALATSVLATVLAGPLVPLADAGVGFADRGQWLVRGAFFVLVGLVTAMSVSALRARQDREVEVAQRELDVAEHSRALAVQRAALIQTVSHELRTPLTTIKGSVELLYHRFLPELRPEAAGKLVPPLLRSVRRLEELVTMVLAVADADTDGEVVPVTVGLRDLLDAAVERAPTGSRDRVQRRVEGEVDTVTTVPDYVVTALSCLLDNALRFSPDDTPVELIARRDGGVATELVVCDHGPGISPVVAPRMFEAFTQADASTTREHEGLGVGLFTTRKLVRRLGGDVVLEPGADGGTVARLRLPDPAPVIGA